MVTLGVRLRDLPKRGQNWSQQLIWGKRMVAIMRKRPGLSANRLEEKFGWIEALADDLIQQIRQLDALDASGKQLAAELVKVVPRTVREAL